MAIPSMAYAASNDSICNGIGAATSAGSGCGSGQPTSLNHTITYVVNILSIIGGIMAVFAIVYAGLRFVLSGGESANVGAAKNTILYAAIGLVVIGLAQIIVHFVLNHLP